MSEETPSTGAQSILDAVSHSQQSQTLRELNPQQVVFRLLEKLSEREREVLINRYGLETGQIQTLETIGQKLKLTRERIRQIEKEAFNKLKKRALPLELTQAIDLIYQILEAGGGILSEKKLLDTLLPTKTVIAEKDTLFILYLSDRLKLLKENQTYNQSWQITNFNLAKLNRSLEAAVSALRELGKPTKTEALTERVKTILGPQGESLTGEVLENFLETTKKIDNNPFGQWGLSDWPEIHPKDVGDKAYLILEQDRNPQHYEKITELINRQKFDGKHAHKETVHNELIKDDRFVLIGRGIYALKKWGFKKGTVGDVIERILREAARPLSKNEIVEEVLKQRMVKKNTVIVGLSNKTRFIKTADNKYHLAETEKE